MIRQANGEAGGAARLRRSDRARVPHRLAQRVPSAVGALTGAVRVVAGRRGLDVAPTATGLVARPPGRADGHAGHDPQRTADPQPEFHAADRDAWITLTRHQSRARRGRAGQARMRWEAREPALPA